MSLYENPKAPAAERALDLLSRLTLEEKVGQLCLFAYSRKEMDFFRSNHTGALLNVFGEELARAQAALTEAHRLHVPILFGLDCIHGHCLYKSATAFPNPLGLSMTWDPDLLHEVGKATAAEMAVTGILWTFAPNLDVVRDLRWGRIEETLGEDPWLVGILGGALISGLQNDGDLSGGVLACGKHFCGYSETRGGRDSTETTLSLRHLLQICEPPYRLAARSGLRTVMAGYHAVDGTPCSISKPLLTGILRDRIGFDGFVVSDFNNIRLAFDMLRIGDSIEELCVQSLEAGNDMPMHTREFPDAIIGAVRSGRLDAAVLDESCIRILRAKFELGLFEERRRPALELIPGTMGKSEHLALADRAAVQSVVLLNNREELLPLRTVPKRIAVLGPHAHNLPDQLGCWTAGFGEMVATVEMTALAAEFERTILQGIRERAGAKCEVVHARGCSADDDLDEITEAVEAARGADLVVLALGDSQKLTGEKRDRATLGLRGKQMELFRAVKATGRPVIVVLVLTKPLAIPELATEASTLLSCWNPGARGGVAIASIMFGDSEPGGRLTVTFPHALGQTPCHYLQEPGWHGKGHYVDLLPESKRPVYPFGFGLGYTTYRIENLQLESSKVCPDGPVRGTLRVTNTGDREGTAVAQFYIQDVRASVSRPEWWLGGFVRAELKAGESREVAFELPFERLAIVNAAAEWVVEPGEFKIGAGQCFDPESFLIETTMVEPIGLPH